MKYFTLFGFSFLFTAIQAQETVTVTTGPGNAVQTYYSLQNGVVDSRPLNEWDLAFEIPGFTASILVNTAKGMQAWKAPYAVASWNDVDTTGMAASWIRIHNSDTSWSHGALNQGLTEDEFDLGWGMYNFVTHQVAGDSIFVLKLANGEYKKLRIDGLVSSTYTFTWASLDGSNEQTGTLSKGGFAGKNFGYYSLDNAEVIDREPASSDWDLVFTKYVALSPSAYPVTGVLTNRNRPALRVDGVEPALADWQEGEYSNHINTIGYDWKTFNMQTFQYEYDEDLSFFVYDADGNVWQLLFFEFGGASTGDISFTQQLMSAVSVEEVLNGNEYFTLFPNPARDGHVQLLIGGDIRNAVVTLHDMSGRMVSQQMLTGLDNGTLHTMDISPLPGGMYVVRLVGAGVSASQRLVIE